VCRAVDYLVPTPIATPVATPTVAPIPTPTVPPSSVVVATPTPAPTPPPATISGRVPPQGFGLVVYSGTLDQLVTASGCPRATSAFFFTFDGRFVAYIPGAQVTVVNAEVLSKFSGGNVPASTPLVAKCV
jgi:hypothetical protein